MMYNRPLELSHFKRIMLSLSLFGGQIKRLIGSNQETLGILERLVAGSLAGAIAQSSIYPMEVRNHSVAQRLRCILSDYPAFTFEFQDPSCIIGNWLSLLRKVLGGLSPYLCFQKNTSVA